MKVRRKIEETETSVTVSTRGSLLARMMLYTTRDPTAIAEAKTKVDWVTLLTFLKSFLFFIQMSLSP